MLSVSFLGFKKPFIDFQYICSEIIYQMKKISFFCLLLICGWSYATAQSLRPSFASLSTHQNLTTPDKMKYTPHNVIKWNVGSLIGSTLSLSYERSITRKWSVNIHGSLLMRRNLPDWVVERLWKNDAEANQKLTIGKPSFNGWGLTPEVRYYFLPGQTAPNGLYAAAYLRIWRYNANMAAFYKNPDQNIDTQLEARVSYYAVRPGLQIGYNWIINQHFSLDGFVGANYGVNGASLMLKSDIILDVYDKVIEEFVQVSGSQGPIVEKIATNLKDKLSFKADRVRVGGTFGLPGIRSGLTLGYAF